MLIRSGETRLVGWSRNTLYSGFITLHRSVVRRQTDFAARITRTLSGLEQFIQNDNDNPYAPPVNTGHRISERAFVRRRRTGPTLYVALLGLTGGLFSPAVMENHFGIALLFPTVGCIAGAMIYRYRSSAWPIDPTAFRRALFCSHALTAIHAISPYSASRNRA